MFQPDFIRVEDIDNSNSTFRKMTASNVGLVIHAYRKNGRSSRSVDQMFNSLLSKITRRVNEDRVKANLGKYTTYDTLRDLGNKKVAITPQELTSFGTGLSRLQGYDNFLSFDEVKEGISDLANDFLSHDDCTKFLKPEEITGEEAIDEVVEGETSESESETETELEKILETAAR